MTDDEKLAFDITISILDRIKQEVDFSEVDPFTMKYLRGEIQDILLRNFDFAEERFQQAFDEGESKGYDTALREARERIRDFADDF